MMAKKYLAIAGLGNVGRRLLELIERKRDTLKDLFNLEFILAGICDTSGAAIDRNGLNIKDVIAAKKQKKGIAALPGGAAGMTEGEFIRSVEADVFVELTLTNLKDGEPGLSSIRSALNRKMHVVTANKGPLVLAYSELATL